MNAAICAVIIAAVVLAVVLAFKNEKPEYINATLIDKTYTPSSTSTGVGYGVMTNGEFGTVVMSSSESEKWTVVVEAGQEVFAVKASARQWASLKPGDAVVVRKSWSGRTIHTPEQP